MSVKTKGLGRGLEALFQDDDEEAIPSEVQKLPLAQITPNPTQPRRDFDEEALRDLAESIKIQGILQPLIVRPLSLVPETPEDVSGESAPNESGLRKYEIVAGERRWRAAHLANLSEVPVIVKDLNDQEALAIALIENLQRENLNPLEEALAMQRLKDEFNLSQEELSAQLGKSRSAIANALRLLKLPTAAMEDLRSGKISAGHARALLSFESEEEREKTRVMILENRLSVREVEDMAAEAKERAQAEQSAGNSSHGPNQQDGQPDGRPDSLAGVQEDGGEDNLAGQTPPNPRTLRMQALQTRLEETIRMPVKLSGRESRGKLKITYSSREELTALFKLLGLENA